MAFARFARDSMSFRGFRPIGGNAMTIDSLASRVNAIDPYDILRYRITQCAIGNILDLWVYSVLEIPLQRVCKILD